MFERTPGLPSRLLSLASAGAGFLRDERGQDLVEYALLGATIGIGSIAVLNILRSTMGTSYTSWTTSTGALWDPPAPSGS